MDRTLSGATTPGQSGRGSNGNEGVLRIPQSPSITGTSLSDRSASYPGYSLGGGVLTLCRGAVGVFFSPSRLGNDVGEGHTFMILVGILCATENLTLPQFNATNVSGRKSSATFH